MYCTTLAASYLVLACAPHDPHSSHTYRCTYLSHGMIHTSDTCCHGGSLVEDSPLLIQYPSPGEATPKTFGTLAVYNLRYDRWCCSAHLQRLCFLPLNPCSFLLRHLLLLFLLHLQHSVLHPHSHHWSCYHRMHVSFVHTAMAILPPKDC